MTRLEDLIYSLATVLVRYHQIRGFTVSLDNESDKLLKAEKPRTLAASIINSDKPKFKDKLSELITQCTLNHVVRQPFLTYILNELIFLKSIHSRTDVLQKNELPQYETVIFQMIQQFKQLLTIRQDETTAIKYSTLPGSASDGANIKLNGLINTAIFGPYYCNSGTLLLEEVFYWLNLTDKSSSDEIQSTAQDIVSEYQNKLIAYAAEQHQQESAEELNSLKERHEGILDEKENQIHELECEVTRLQKEIEGLQNGTSRIANTGTFNPLMFGFLPKHSHHSFTDSAQKPRF